GLVFYKVKFVGTPLSWCSSALATAGFTFSAVVAGVFLGLWGPTWLDEGELYASIIPLQMFLLFSFFAHFFVFMSHLIDERNLSDAERLLGRWSQAFAIVLGLGLISLGAFSMLDEPWKETQPSECVSS